MNVAAGPELAAAVTNAGGLGVIGGVGYTPKILRQQVSGQFLHGSALLNGCILFLFLFLFFHASEKTTNRSNR
jgi:hypothetical protein